MTKRILIISANFYPVLGPRPHRSTELAKELSRRGHQVTVYTLKGGYDYSEFESKYGVIVKDLGKSEGGLRHNDGSINLSIWNRLKIKFLKNYLQYPFNELVSKVNRVLELENNSYDVLITIAVPHPIHWGASKYFQKHNKKAIWIADCGDPFMNNPFHRPPNYFESFERKWCELVDYITIPIEEGKSGYYEEYRHKIKVIPQGFDMTGTKLAQYTGNDVPTFAYSGVFYPVNRDPSKLLSWLSTLEIDFKFVIYTNSPSILEPYMSKLGSKLEVRGYVPREQLIYELSKMDFLVNIKNNSAVQQPSKLIDYYLTKRPIIDVTSEFGEQNNFFEFVNGNYKNPHVNLDVSKFDIRNVVNEFEDLFIENRVLH